MLLLKAVLEQVGFMASSYNHVILHAAVVKIAPDAHLLLGLQPGAKSPFTPTGILEFLPTL